MLVIITSYSITVGRVVIMMAFLISMWVTLGLFFNYGSSVKAYSVTVMPSLNVCITLYTQSLKFRV